MVNAVLSTVAEAAVEADPLRQLALYLKLADMTSSSTEPSQTSVTDFGDSYFQDPLAVFARLRDSRPVTPVTSQMAAGNGSSRATRTCAARSPTRGSPRTG
jgi:hypothetical protein